MLAEIINSKGKRNAKRLKKPNIIQSKVNYYDSDLEGEALKL